MKSKYFPAVVVLFLFLAVIIRDKPKNIQELVLNQRLRSERLLMRAYYFMKAEIFPLAEERDLNIKLGVPFHRQERALSCEIATLKMVLNYYGISVTEDELLASLPFDDKNPRDGNNIWGDPEVGFVGDINGKMPNVGYGVYESPIARIALRYKNARPMINAGLADILGAVANKKPVIVWGHVSNGKDISWKTEDGKEIKAVFGEHTRVIIGFSGTVSDPKDILLLDPVYGRLRLSKENFLENWASLDNRAVLVY